MSSASGQSIHEVDVCGQIASEANLLFAQDLGAFPFSEARAEGFGNGTVAEAHLRPPGTKSCVDAIPAIR